MTTSTTPIYDDLAHNHTYTCPCCHTTTPTNTWTQHHTTRPIGINNPTTHSQQRHTTTTACPQCGDNPLTTTTDTTP